MKKLLFFAFAAVLCCGLTACSSDDDGGNDGDATYEELIVGNWEVYKEFWYDGDGWDYEFGYRVFQQTFQFTANGTFIETGAEWYEGDKETWSDRGTYTLSGDRISLTWRDGYTEVWKIVTLNNSELVVTRSDKGVSECDAYMRRM